MKINFGFIKDAIGIIIGTILCGIGFSLFLIPYKSSPGGVGGIAQIFYYLFQFPAGISMLMINIPLFIVGLIAFGKQFGIKTIVGMFSLTFFTDFFSSRNMIKVFFLRDYLFKINDRAWSLSNEPFLAIMAGSVIVGAGFGLVIKFNGSTGGTDIPALLMRKYFGFTIGNSYLIIDTFIIFVIGTIFKNPNLFFWGLLSLVVSSKICDLVLEGFSYSKGVMIVTDKSTPVRKSIMTELHRGCTIFYGKGSFSESKKEIVYTVINRREIPKVKSILKNIDTKAFVTISDVHETLGTGFKKL